MVTVLEKETIRKQLLEKLLSLTSSEVERRSKNVERNLQKISEFINAKYIMVYYPLKGEVDLLGMVRKILNEKVICFPFINGRDLLPYQVKDLGEDFMIGPFGVTQPKPREERQCALPALDVVLVPGIAFDREYHRLGRGAGYYDRFLKKLSAKTKKIGISFDFQVLEALPHQPSQDENVDVVVTDTFSI
jgi:5-formyltetrahydrofolate cyclo-ligase